jgi:hypothetical protein
MLADLPGWVIDNAASVRAEVAEWRHLSEAELWRLAVLCSRDTIWAIRASGEASRILERVDPLPSDTVEALARLRRQAGWAGGDS